MGNRWAPEAGGATGPPGKPQPLAFKKLNKNPLGKPSQGTKGKSFADVRNIGSHIFRMFNFNHSEHEKRAQSHS